jgi:hypothetical protein
MDIQKKARDKEKIDMGIQFMSIELIWHLNKTNWKNLIII